MIVVGAVVLLLTLLWFLLPPDAALRTGRRRRDDEEGPESVPSDFGRWPGLAASPAENREATLTRQLLAGTVEPGVYRRLMAELARDDERSDGHRRAGPRA